MLLVFMLALDDLRRQRDGLKSVQNGFRSRRRLGRWHGMLKLVPQTALVVGEPGLKIPSLFEAALAGDRRHVMAKADNPSVALSGHGKSLAYGRIAHGIVDFCHGLIALLARAAPRAVLQRLPGSFRVARGSLFQIAIASIFAS